MRFKLTEWMYVEATVAAFIFLPGVRRIADWATHFSSVNVFAIVPLLMLVPIAVLAYRRRGRVMQTPFWRIAIVWTAAFLYALVVGTAQLSLLAGISGIGLFVLPLVIGAWLASRPETMEAAFARMSRDLLVFGAIAGAYGIFQYVVAPPWDTTWMQNIQADSFGLPVPFGIRVFSVLNGPGVFGNFMASALILNLRNVRFSKPLTLLAMLLMLAGLVLSLVRIAWLAFVLGAFLTFIFGPGRRRIATSFATMVTAAIVLGVAFLTVVPADKVQDQLANRLSTLGDVQEDASAQQRQETGRLALRAALNNPAGFGLGTTGSTGALKSSTATVSGLPTDAIDNGYISRFVEMGVIGVTGFCIALGLALVATYRAFRAARKRNPAAAGIIGTSLAIQISLLFTCLAGDLYSGIGSVVFFLIAGLPFMSLAATPVAARAKVVRSKMPREARRFAT